MTFTRRALASIPAWVVSCWRATRCSALGIAVLAAMSASAWAAFPERPITLVVNSEAGGPTDLLARVLRDEMARILGQSVTIENRPAAGGVVGATQIAQSAPDGYRVLVSGAGPLALAPALYPATVSYKTLDAFRAVNVTVDVPVFLAATNEIPADNLKDYIALAKKEPGKYSYGTAGIGTPAHLMSELFKKTAGIDVRFIPYQGSPAAVLALLRGDISFHVVTPAVALPHYEAGKLRLLAVSGSRRLPKAPNVPTFEESGMPEVVAPAWFGFFVPKGTPNEVVEVLDNAIKRAAASPKAVEVLTGANFNIRSLAGADGDRFLRSEVEKWGAFIKANDVKGQ